jgi:hypothetical protein
MPDPPGTEWLKQQTQRAVQQTKEIPLGPVPGQRTLLPQYNDLGATRPFGPGESVRMPNGAVTSEESVTIQMPDGKWAVVPGLWLVNGVPTKVDEDQALQLATQSGLDWALSGYSSSDEADKYANEREMNWERNADTRTQPPLWKRKEPPT